MSQDCGQFPILCRTATMLQQQATVYGTPTEKPSDRRRRQTWPYYMYTTMQELNNLRCQPTPHEPTFFSHGSGGRGVAVCASSQHESGGQHIAHTRDIIVLA